MTDQRNESCDIKIGGMHCAGCELLLERKLKALPGVQAVDIDYKTGTGTVIAQSGNMPGASLMAETVEKEGYTLIGTDDAAALPADRRTWMEIGASLIVIFALYKLLQTFDLLSLAPSTSGALTFGGVFLIGLVAGMSSCLAVTGGLLLALAAKHNELHRAETPMRKFLPLLHFNIGRLVSYFVLGGLVGLLGQSITLNPRMTGYMNVVIALVMIYLALTMLGVVRKGRFHIRPPKSLSRKIANIADSDHPAAPFTLGALTFFLPCGFTQSLQLVALASGSFKVGAMVMFVFALGTLPALLGISAISAAAKGKASSLFLRFSGTLVLILALFNLQNGLALSGFDAVGNGKPAVPLPAVTGDLQEVSMTVTPYGYEPQNLTIQAGIPVRWKIDGTEANGCTSVMTIPSLNISQVLHAGENIIEFTAPAKGQLAFMCSMGMVRGSFTVL